MRNAEIKTAATPQQPPSARKGKPNYGVNYTMEYEDVLDRLEQKLRDLIEELEKSKRETAWKSN